MTYPVTDSSARTTHTEVAITQPGVIQYTVYVRKGCHCASDIMIVADIMTVLFSKWQLPSCCLLCMCLICSYCGRRFL